MQYLIGSLVTVVFFVAIGGAYLMGQRHSKPKQKTEPLTEEQKKRAQEIKKAYAEMMGYDADKARGGTT